MDNYEEVACGRAIFNFVFFPIKCLLVMFLWNWFMDDLFNLPELDYLHAVGFVFLIRLITR